MRPALVAPAVAAAFLLPGSASPAGPQPRPGTAALVRALKATDDPTFRPGQVWRYHTRPLEQRSVLVVCGVDSAPGLGTIVHVQVKGIRIRRRASALGYITRVDHLPLMREALVTSVTELQRSDEACEDFDAAYWKWRRELLPAAADSGVFRGSVAESLDLLERSSRSRSTDETR